ncbi:MAG: hypothetical protein WDN45_12140 [Caulobacteraceae bacterium]
MAAGLPLPGAVWAGSAGMAEPLAAALSPRAPVPQPLPERGRGPHLVVVGSASSVSRRQLDELRRDPGVLLIRISPKVLLEGPGAPGWRPASRSLVAAIGRPGKDVVAAAIDPEAMVDPANGPRLAAGARPADRAAAAPLRDPWSPPARDGPQSAGRHRRHGLNVLREIEPGIPLSALEGHGLPVATKAGSFGNPRSLARCIEVLRTLPLAPRELSGASLPE